MVWKLEIIWGNPRVASMDMDMNPRNGPKTGMSITWDKRVSTVVTAARPNRNRTYIA